MKVKILITAVLIIIAGLVWVGDKMNDRAYTLADIEPMINVCNEPSFLKCTNKNKLECETAFNFTNTYCDKKFRESVVDWNNRHEHMNVYKECSNKSLVAYFDDDSKNLYTCLSKTRYKQRLKIIMNELLKK